MKKIYLDHAATTYLDPVVKKTMDNFWDQKFGNPSALYSLGREADTNLQKARKTMADILHCSDNEIIFTGSGTESDNLALLGFAKTQEVGEIIISSIEHHAVLHSARYLESLGWKLKIAKVNKKGFVDVEYFKKLLTKQTKFISIMYANNEIGTIQPITKLVKLAKSINTNIIFHTDACQAGPYLDLNVRKLGVDMMTLNGSKVYGPKGVGLLFKKNDVVIKPIIYGGGQEFGLRSGTENIPAIMGLAKALQITQKNKVRESKRLMRMRDDFIKKLINNIDQTYLNGSLQNRLPNNINITFADIEGEAILLYLDRAGIMANTGSACASHDLDVSHVLKAIGLPYEMIHGSIRFTLGKKTTAKDLDYVVSKMKQIVKILRAMSPVRIIGSQHPQVKK